MKTPASNEEIVLGGNQQKNWKSRASLLIIFPVLVFLEIGIWYIFLPAALKGNLDFRAFYGAAYMVRTGHASELYNYESVRQFQTSLLPRDRAVASFTPYTHPASEAAAYVPLTFLAYRNAYVLFTFLNLVLLACATTLLLRSAPSTVQWPQILLVFSFIPLSLSLVFGQDTVLVLFFLSAATVLMLKQKDMAAGFLAGLCLIRFQIALPIALLFFAWRRWRFALGFGISAVLVLGSSVVIMGLDGTRHYVHGLIAMSGESLPESQPYYRQFPGQMPNLRGLVATLAGSHLSPAATQFVIFVLSGLLTIWAMTRRPKSGADALALAVPVAVLLSYHGYEHDASILLIPLMFSFSDSSEENIWASWAGLALVAAQACAVLLRNWTCLISIPLLAYTVIRGLDEKTGHHGNLPRNQRAKELTASSTEVSVATRNRASSPD